jgi:hypothetical protein
MTRKPNMQRYNRDLTVSRFVKRVVSASMSGSAVANEDAIRHATQVKGIIKTAMNIAVAIKSLFSGDKR